MCGFFCHDKRIHMSIMWSRVYLTTQSMYQLFKRKSKEGGKSIRNMSINLRKRSTRVTFLMLSRGPTPDDHVPFFFQKKFIISLEVEKVSNLKV